MKAHKRFTMLAAASAVVMGMVGWAFAQGFGLDYVIGYAPGVGIEPTFEVTKGGQRVAASKTITELIEAIRQDVGQNMGGDLNTAEIQFGVTSAPEDQGLNIGSQTVEFANDHMNPWGVALTGRITSSGSGPTIEISPKVNISSQADITHTNGGFAIKNNGGQLTISNGTVQAYCTPMPCNTQSIYLNGRLNLLGSPTISGNILVMSGNLFTHANFAPGNKTYSIFLDGTVTQG